jgi:hypothetical protein
MYALSEMPEIRAIRRSGEISHFRAYFPFSMCRPTLENPVNPPFIVPVENKPGYWSICQNTAGIPLTHGLPKGFWQGLF